MDKILVVDDDARGLHNVATFLRFEDYDVDEAGDGNKALLFLQQAKFDLVLSDVMMPGLDGFGLLEHIRSIFPEIPVLLMSAFFEFDVEEIIKRGAVDFIAKPLDLEVLLSRVRRALESGGLRTGKVESSDEKPF